MLNDFTWNMTGYIPKHQVNPRSDGIIPYVAERIFQLEPEPPKVGSEAYQMYPLIPKGGRTDRENQGGETATLPNVRRR